VQTLDEVKEDQVEQRESAKRERALAEDAADEEAVLAAIDTETATHPGATRTNIRGRTKLHNDRVRELLESLVECGQIEETDFKKEIGSGVMRSVTGYRRVRGYSRPSVPTV
jgi:hypothetical protein